MKKYILILFIPALLLGACHKVLTQTTPDPLDQDKPPVTPPQDSTVLAPPPIPPVIPKDTSKVPYPTNTATAPPAPSCPLLPIYGDTLIFPQPTSGSDYIVTPFNNPGKGKYFSWPVGMIMDQNTGAINVTQSYTGMKYAIGFVKDGSTDTCLSHLIIGGISYLDSVYVMSAGATTCWPYYDADPSLATKCQNGGCSFDVTGSAGNNKVIVDKGTGVIDLQKTLNGGLLGGMFGLIPINGSSKTVTIYYKVNDASNSALQHIDVQFVYYDSKSNISNTNPNLLTGIVNIVNDLVAGHVISNYASPRPPLVVIVRRF